MFFLLFFFLSSALASSDLICSSLPEFEPYDTSLYFACTCPQEGMEGQFSLASFAYNLSHSIFDRSLVVDLRDCLSMDIIMDQLQLNLVLSDYFRPDIQFKEINVENIFQVRSFSHLSLYAFIWEHNQFHRRDTIRCDPVGSVVYWLAYSLG